MKRDSVESFTVGKVKVRIEVDDDPPNPRENDNVGTMACWHRRYNLGDEQPKQSAGEYFGALADALLGGISDRCERALAHFNTSSVYYQAAERYWDRKRVEVLDANYTRLPLGLYDHSGITMYVGCNHPTDGAGWDSGQVGVIYASLQKARENWLLDKTQPDAGWDYEMDDWDRDGKMTGGKISLRKATERLLEGEVKEYDSFITGDCYGYVVEDEDGETLDSCWGFIGCLDYVRQEARESAERENERLIDEEKKENAESHDAACRDIATVS